MKVSAFVITILSIFSPLYLSGYMGYGYLSPVYFGCVFSFFLFYCYILEKGTIQFDSVVLVCVLLFLYTFTTNIYNNSLDFAKNWLLGQFVFILAVLLKHKVDKKLLLGASKYIILSTSFIVIIDTIHRFMNPDIELYEKMRAVGFDFMEAAIYIYKTNSLMFTDSNYIGLLTVIVYFFAVLVLKHSLTITKKMLIILTLLTFSRAAIITLFFFRFVLYIYSKYSHKISKVIYVFVFITIFFVALLLFFALGLHEDASFGTKFLLWVLTYRFFSASALTVFLFGCGVGSAGDLIGVGAHNILLGMLYGGGIVGIALHLFFFYILTKKTSNIMLVILFPFFMIGFSFADYMVYFYLILALVYLFHRNEHQNNTTNYAHKNVQISI